MSVYAVHERAKAVLVVRPGPMIQNVAFHSESEGNYSRILIPMVLRLASGSAHLAAKLCNDCLLSNGKSKGGA
jgi:hypothetical protein